MEDDRQKVFQELLESRLEALISNASGHLGAMVERRENHADAADIASEESSREFSLRLHEHERQTIGAIRAALRRIEEGEYGYCVACGEDIGCLWASGCWELEAEVDVLSARTAEATFYALAGEKILGWCGAPCDGEVRTGPFLQVLKAGEP